MCKYKYNFKKINIWQKLQQVVIELLNSYEHFSKKVAKIYVYVVTDTIAKHFLSFFVCKWSRFMFFYWLCLFIKPGHTYIIHKIGYKTLQRFSKMVQKPFTPI